MNGNAPPLAVEQQLHAGEAALQLPDAGDGADSIERLGCDGVHVLPLGHCEDELVRMLECRLDGAQRSRPAGPDRGGDTGEEHDFAEGQHRQCQTFGHPDSFSMRPPIAMVREAANWTLLVQRSCQ